jgi:hypothetical protein
LTRNRCTFSAALVILVTVLLGGCSSPELAPTPQPTVTDTAAGAAITVPPTPTLAVAGKPCASGKLLIGDLPAIDQVWRQGLEQATAKAIEWQQDAVLSNLRVVCQLFEAEFRWQATFYSRNAQAFFSSDTREVMPARVEESAVPTLNTDGLSFALLHQALVDAGYGNDFEISPSSGVDIRVNSATSPFGPPEAPDDVILYHVSIERLGEVKDVFVSGRDGTIYLYSR